jgi:hypothetical protein
LHQTHQCSQTAAVDELYLVELQHDIAVLVDGVSDVGVQGEDFIAGHDSSVALNNQDLANRAALKP